MVISDIYTQISTLVISTLGSLVISWWSRSPVRAWLSDKPPVTTLVSIPGWWLVPGLTWLHYRPSITSLTPPTHPSCCSATAAAASQLLPSCSCEPRCCLTTKKPLAGPEWWRVQAARWYHHTGLAVVTIGALCSVLAMLGGPQSSPAQPKCAECNEPWFHDRYHRLHAAGGDSGVTGPRTRGWSLTF